MSWVFIITSAVLFLVFVLIAIVTGCGADDAKEGFKRRLLTTLCVAFSLTAMLTVGSCFWHAPPEGEDNSKTLGGIINQSLIKGAKKTKLGDGRRVWDEFN